MRKLKTVGAYVIAQRNMREMKDEEYMFVAIEKELWNEGHRDVVDFEADSPDELEDWAIPEDKNTTIVEETTLNIDDIKNEPSMTKLEKAQMLRPIMDQSEWEEYVTDELDIRVCSECGKPMDEGYCIDNGYEYYCTDDCLHKHYSQASWDLMTEDDDSECYWTEWK